MKPEAVIGIDNGACSGAMCALCPESGSLLGYALMPSTEHNGTTEADPKALVAWLENYTCLVIGIEEPPKHAGSAASMRSMSMSFGLCYGAMVQAGLPAQRINVHEWQKAILGKVPKGLTKEYALRKADGQWPGERWLPSPRHRTPHSGIVDAALIAEFTRKKVLGK